jgi:hypothetical protein
MGGSFHQDPVVVQNLDGRLELFVLGDGGHLFDLAQSAPNGGWWSSWADLGAPPSGGAAGQLAVARNLDGRLELFLRGADNKIYHRWQQGAGGALTATWASMGGSFGRSPSAGRNQDGRLEVFAVRNDGSVHQDWQVAPNAGWA